MSYIEGNPRTKAEVKRAIKEGKILHVFNPGLGTIPVNGKVYLEGPHYPEPHKWYAEGTMKDGRLVSVK